MCVLWSTHNKTKTFKGMKKTILALALVLVATSVMAQADGGFPDQPGDPNGVPIIESIVALLGLGGAYVVRLVRKNKKQ